MDTLGPAGSRTQVSSYPGKRADHYTTGCDTSRVWCDITPSLFTPFLPTAPWTPRVLQQTWYSQVVLLATLQELQKLKVLHLDHSGSEGLKESYHPPPPHTKTGWTYGGQEPECNGPEPNGLVVVGMMSTSY